MSAPHGAPAVQREARWNLTHAINMQTAQQTFSAPAAALLDIGLPDMNGYELARRIRQLPTGAQAMLIATTGWGQQKDRERAFEAGFDHHITKPIDFELLQPLLHGLAADDT